MDRQKAEPVYQQFTGWNSNTDAAKDYATLPDRMKEYVKYINEYLGVNIHYISNGPGRDQLIKVF